MEREPSLHVTRSTLIKIVKNLDIKLSKPNIDRIMVMARELSADNRTMIAKAKERKQLRNIEGSIGEANMVAQLIYGIRVRLKHIGVTKIKQIDPAWGQVRQLVPTMNQFCETHHFKNKREGYIQFLEIGFDLMAKNVKKLNYNYCASWMLKNAGFIEETFSSRQDIMGDPYPAQTREFMQYYQSLVSEMSGMYIDYTKNPKDYVCFLKGRELADKWGVDYETYIDAQFAALRFCNGIPRLPDLCNEKAEQRLAQYSAKNGITLKQASISENTWDSFKS